MGANIDPQSNQMESEKLCILSRQTPYHSDDYMEKHRVRVLFLTLLDDCVGVRDTNVTQPCMCF